MSQPDPPSEDLNETRDKKCERKLAVLCNCFVSFLIRLYMCRQPERDILPSCFRAQTEICEIVCTWLPKWFHSSRFVQDTLGATPGSVESPSCRTCIDLEVPQVPCVSAATITCLADGGSRKDLLCLGLRSLYCLLVS
jgi:hypothetical protein